MPGPHLRDRQLDRAHRVSHVRVRLPLRYAVRSPRALVPLGPDQAGDLRLHQRLRQHPNALPAARPRPAPRGACQRTPTDPSLAWPSSSPSVCASSARRTHGTMRDGRFACLAAAALPNFHHVPGLYRSICPRTVGNSALEAGSCSNVCAHSPACAVTLPLFPGARMPLAPRPATAGYRIHLVFWVAPAGNPVMDVPGDTPTSPVMTVPVAAAVTADPPRTAKLCAEPSDWAESPADARMSTASAVGSDSRQTLRVVRCGSWT